MSHEWATCYHAAVFTTAARDADSRSPFGGATDASKGLSSQRAGHIDPSSHRHFSGQRYPLFSTHNVPTNRLA
jgi:hypothetical protein